MDIYPVCDVIDLFTKYAEHGDADRLGFELVNNFRGVAMSDVDRQYLQHCIDELLREFNKKSL